MESKLSWSDCISVDSFTLYDTDIVIVKSSVYSRVVNESIWRQTRPEKAKKLRWILKMYPNIAFFKITLGFD